MSTPPGKRKRVFISYSHDSDEHRDRVLGLSEDLRKEDLETVLDQYFEAAPPKEGWSLWMEQRIDEADFALMVCTEGYAARVQRTFEPGKGQGGKWEGAIVRTTLYEDEGNTKFIPVLLEPDDRKFIPRMLRDTTRYDLTDDKDWQALLRRLTNQPRVVAGEPSGSTTSLPQHEPPANWRQSRRREEPPPDPK